MDKSYRFILSIVFIFIFSGCVTITTPRYDVEVEIKITDYEKWSQGTEAKQGKIRLYGSIGYSTSLDLATKLTILNTKEEVKRIRVIINSTGGQVAGYRSIINAFYDCRKPIDVIVIGSCYSAGCVILQSATGKRIAYKNAHFMVHRVQSSSSKATDAVNYESKIYEAILLEKSNLPRNWFPLKKEYKFFDAKFALKHNFIDEIYDPSNKTE